jgi:NAD(P)-dependent dehydrogenase (short-subunit alcohol dehydrogenase family)
LTAGRLKDRIALITGASRGLGRSVAEAFAREGAHVLLLARTRKSLEEIDDAIKAQGGTATLIPLSLAHGPKIDALGPALYERFGKLDVLVGNAAILGRLSPLPHIPSEHWEHVMNVNVTANWRLIRSLDPLLRQSDAGRALFVTSDVTHRFPPYWGAYSVSKAALDALVRTYAAEIRQSKATANLFNPGRLRTRMRAQAVPGEDPMTLKTPEDVAPAIVRMLSPSHAGNGTYFDFPTGETRALLPPQT